MVPVMAATVVAVDVGRNKAVLSVTDAALHRLLGPAEFAMTAPVLAAALERVWAVLPDAAVKVGVRVGTPLGGENVESSPCNRVSLPKSSRPLEQFGVVLEHGCHHAR